MTTVYFIRHAQSDHNNGNEQTRGLSEQGKIDVHAVTRFLADKNIYAAYSSPYQRAIDTIEEYTQKQNMPIQILDGFREWYRQKDISVNFDDMCRRHWEDFDYKYSNGESLHEVQQRNIAALHEVLNVSKDKNVIIGTHGMALSTIIHFYNRCFNYDDFSRLLPIMPLVVKMTFDGLDCLDLEQIKIV